jgi:HPt (histidine-containing phosphotransfer) domain-containing protein
LPEIAGLDAAIGLTRIGGSQRRYLDLLALFCRDAAAGSALLETEPDEASLRSFTTLAHALKSALAAIGAEELSQMAAVLEAAGRDAELPVIRAKLAPFRENLAALTARIGAVLEGTRPGADGGRDAPDLENAVLRLREALQGKDVDAMDAALAQLQNLPLTAGTRARVAELADHILVADFKKAEAGLAALLRAAASPP